MTADAREAAFQKDIVAEMVDAGWKTGTSAHYDRERALYSRDCLDFVRNAQPREWEKFEKLYPEDPEKAFLDRLVHQLSKADPHASNRELRKFGTLGVVRNPLRDRSVSFDLCQFKPEHGLNPITRSRYNANILRVVPELIYSPHASAAELAATGTQAKKWRIDLVLFVNGIPVVTMELKSEFKQAVDKAKEQYCKTRQPKDRDTGRAEPLLTFKRGALVHFAVSQNEVWMTTKLAGDDTYFLPFNQGTKDGGAGNDTPEDLDTYATAYLWKEVLAPVNLLEILQRFIHLEIETDEDWEGRKVRKEKMIFPRYHQWDLVKQLIRKTAEEGPGHKYLVQHSAGSGKSNSIAWTAHQLASLHTRDGDRLFDSVIVITDRTVLDKQLQDTVSQFDAKKELVFRVRTDEGQGSKSSKLAHALEQRMPIILVTIQTFPHVLEHLAADASLRERRYALIADEAHSSQTGSTAQSVKEVLAKSAADEGVEISAEDRLLEAVEARRNSENLSYYAFTATPKAKTLELFGRRPDPSLPASKRNKPEPFHVYSMRQAIEEKYILDVLRNYTSYKVAYRLAQKIAAADSEVDRKKAAVKLGQWVRLHDYNIAQKVKAIVEHFRGTVMGLLGGRAKAMIVTGSRKEAVRYQLEFEKYVSKKGYRRPRALVAFSGDVTFTAGDPNAEGLIGETFNEVNMNPGRRGRDLRDVFDTDEYQVMIVANKFQTGFDQPKLCAMYVDKKLGGLECVQTLSRLNRTYPGKVETYVLDFLNDPDEILAAFQEYYETASLVDVSDPNLIWDLYDKLRAAEIFRGSEVEQFTRVFYVESKSQAALTNVCRPAVERWQSRYEKALEEHQRHKELFERTRSTGDAVLIANAESEVKASKRELDALVLFRRDLGSFTRFYEFISQLVDFESPDLEKLSLYARHLLPLLREKDPGEDPVDLSSVALTHYRLSKIKEQKLKLVEDGDEGLKPTTELGSGTAKEKEEVWLSLIIERMNDIFVPDGLTDQDMLSWAYAARDKVGENATVMEQVANNPPDQVLLGDLPAAIDTAVMESGKAHQNLMMQYLNNKHVQVDFQRLVLELLLAQEAERSGARAT